MPHPTVHFVVDRRSAHLSVSPDFYRLDIEQQRAVWDRAHATAFGAGWVAPADDVRIVDEDGTERYPLARWCRVMGGVCAPECRA